MAAGNSLTGGGIYGSNNSQSFTGGGTIGHFDSQSFAGSAQASGLSITVPGTTTAGGLQFGFCFKTGGSSYFGTGIHLVQLGLPNSGYIEVGLNNNNTVWYGMNVPYAGGTWNNTQNPNWPIAFNSWYYVTYALGFVTTTLYQRIYIYQNGIGWADGTNLSCGAALASDTSLAATLGLGMNVTTSTTFAGWQPFPVAPNWEISKVWLRNANTGAPWFGPTGTTALPAPVNDASVSALSPALYYLCRQTPGSAASLIDGSANHYDATAALGGLRILSDGPYA